MIAVAGLVVMVALGAAGTWHLRPSKHPRSIRKHDRQYRKGWMWE